MTDAWLLTLEKFSKEKESVHGLQLLIREKWCATKNIELACVPCAVHDGERIGVCSGIQAVVSEGVVVVLTA